VSTDFFIGSLSCAGGEYGERKFLKKVIAQQHAVAIIRVRFRKNREWNFINH
jgi:hypothetical protein